MILSLISFLNCLWCVIGWWCEFRNTACEEQCGKPDNFAQASGSHLSESIRELPLIVARGLA